MVKISTFQTFSFSLTLKISIHRMAALVSLCSICFSIILTSMPLPSTSFLDTEGAESLASSSGECTPTRKEMPGLARELRTKYNGAKGQYSGGSRDHDR